MRDIGKAISKKYEELLAKRDDPEKAKKEIQKPLEGLKKVCKEYWDKCKPFSISIKIEAKEIKISTYEDIQKLEGELYQSLKDLLKK